MTNEQHHELFVVSGFVIRTSFPQLPLTVDHIFVNAATQFSVHRTPLALLSAPIRHVVASAKIGSVSGGEPGVRSFSARYRRS